MGTDIEIETQDTRVNREVPIPQTLEELYALTPYQKESLNREATRDDFPRTFLFQSQNEAVSPVTFDVSSFREVNGILYATYTAINSALSSVTFYDALCIKFNNPEI